MTTVDMWRRSSRCSSDTACLEVAEAFVTVAVRNSRKPEDVLRLHPQVWRDFVAAVKREEFS